MFWYRLRNGSEATRAPVSFSHRHLTTYLMFSAVHSLNCPFVVSQMIRSDHGSPTLHTQIPQPQLLRSATETVAHLLDLTVAP